MTYWFSSNDDPDWDRSYSPAPIDFLNRAFNSTARDDAYIRENFGEDLENLDSGDYHAWENDHDGRLAAIILYDQFPRNMFRKQAKAFAYDHKALALTKKCLDENTVKNYDYFEQLFILLPLEHAEDKDIANLSVLE